MGKAGSICFKGMSSGSEGTPNPTPKKSNSVVLTEPISKKKKIFDIVKLFTVELNFRYLDKS